MLKTSISLPVGYSYHWRQQRKAIMQNLGGTLCHFATWRPRREGLKSVNTGAVEVVSVYWSQGAYNRLHAVAHALRISVSRLIFMILAFLEKGGQLIRNFNNYEFVVLKWSENCFEFRETLSFDPKSPPKRS